MFVTMDTSCKLYFEGDNICTSNSLVDLPATVPALNNKKKKKTKKNKKQKTPNKQKTTPQKTNKNPQNKQTNKHPPPPSSHLSTTLSLSVCLSVHQLDRLIGQVVHSSPSRSANPGFDSRFRRVLSRPSHTSDLQIGTPGPPCQAPDVKGSAMGLVGPVSVYCEWVR